MKRFLHALAAAIVVLITAQAAPALAITIEVIVNGVPITSYDIDQRVALQQISGQTPSRTTAANELIDEMIQIGEAVRLGVNIPQAQIDGAFANIAQQVGMSVNQFASALRQSGVDPDSLKRRLQAQIAWATLMQARVQTTTVVNQADVTAAMLAAGRQAEMVREYRLQQIIFVVPAGSSSGFIAQRRSEAEAFRQRFQGCEASMAQAAQLRGVVVLDIGRDTSRLTSAQMDGVAATAAGRVSRPEQTGQGIEVVAVCSVVQVQGNEAARTEIQTNLIIERGEEIGTEYLAELRARAIIQRL